MRLILLCQNNEAFRCLVNKAESGLIPLPALETKWFMVKNRFNNGALYFVNIGVFLHALSKVLRLKTYIMTHYETVFILNPVLSEEQIKETVKKFESFLVSKGAKMISKEDWGLKKLAYPIQHKKSGFYHLFEFTSDGEPIGDLEVEFRRDERIMRYLTVKLDKHAVAWAEKRRTRNKQNA